MITISEDDKHSAPTPASLPPRPSSLPPPPYVQEATAENAGPSKPSRGPAPPWKDALRSLQAHISANARARAAGDTAGATRSEAAILASMRTAGNEHPDPRVRRSWRQRARKLATAAPGEKDGLLHDAGRSVCLLLSIPFRLVSGALFGAGVIIIGAGKVVTGIGHVLTGGQFESRPETQYVSDRTARLPEASG